MWISRYMNSYNMNFFPLVIKSHYFHIRWLEKRDFDLFNISSKKFLCWFKPLRETFLFCGFHSTEWASLKKVHMNFTYLCSIRPPTYNLFRFELKLYVLNLQKNKILEPRFAPLNLTTISWNIPSLKPNLRST